VARTGPLWIASGGHGQRGYFRDVSYPDSIEHRCFIATNPSKPALAIG
jgi:hypothetical protein